jgi:hypothetical protein
MSLLNITIEPEIREINNNYLVNIFLPKNIINFTFEIFGDKGYFNSGSIEFTSSNTILSFFINKIQILFLNITENNLKLRYQYFLEMKKYLNTSDMMIKKNIKINISKKSIEENNDENSLNNLDSIWNQEEEDDEEDDEESDEEEEVKD